MTDRDDVERVWRDAWDAFFAKQEATGDGAGAQIDTLLAAKKQWQNEALERAAEEIRYWDPDYRTPQVLADDVRALKEE